MLSLLFCSPSTSVVSSVGVVPLEDLYTLNQYLQVCVCCIKLILIDEINVPKTGKFLNKKIMLKSDSLS